VVWTFCDKEENDPLKRERKTLFSRAAAKLAESKFTAYLQKMGSIKSYTDRKKRRQATFLSLFMTIFLLFFAVFSVPPDTESVNNIFLGPLL
jgi:hypothetical protein